MKPNKKSYAEQFRRNAQGKSSEAASIKKVHNHLIPTRKKSPLLKIRSRTSLESSSRSLVLPGQVVPFTLSRKNKDGDSSHSLGNEKELLETPTNGNKFCDMIQTYANALNLSHIERQCLGFGEVEEDLVYQTKSIDLISSEKMPKLVDSDELAAIMSKPVENPIALPWNNLKNWLGATLGTDFEAEVDDDVNNNAPANEGNEGEESDSDEEPKPGTSASAHNAVPRLPPHKLMKSSILPLLKKKCVDDHEYGNPKNCFKCQHQDGLRSFTKNYIDELGYVWKDKFLTAGQKDEKTIETFAVWTYQLTEQNMSLAEAYGTSARECEKLKGVLLESRNSMRNHQKQFDKEKSMNSAINYELSVRDNAILKLKAQLEKEEGERREIRKKLDETEADVGSLTELIVRLRDKGIWDIHGLPLGNETFQKIFHSDYYLHGSKVIGPKEFSKKKKEWRDEIELLKEESDTLRKIISSKDKEIQRMKIKKGSSPASARNNKIS